MAASTTGSTTSDVAHDTDDHGLHAHPSDGQYIRVALILGVLTAIEVWLSYAGLAAGSPLRACWSSRR